VVFRKRNLAILLVDSLISGEVTHWALSSWHKWIMGKCGVKLGCTFDTICMPQHSPDLHRLVADDHTAQPTFRKPLTIWYLAPSKTGEPKKKAPQNVESTSKSLVCPGTASGKDVIHQAAEPGIDGQP